MAMAGRGPSRARRWGLGLGLGGVGARAGRAGQRRAVSAGAEPEEREGARRAGGGLRLAVRGFTSSPRAL